MSLATIGALVWAIRIGRNDSARASQERRERLTADEWEQAQRVSAWEVQKAEAKPLSRKMVDNGSVYLESHENVRRLFVSNGSDASVFDVIVSYYSSDLQAVALWVQSILPAHSERVAQVSEQTKSLNATADDWCGWVLLPLWLREDVSYAKALPATGQGPGHQNGFVSP